jgi:hypothetical protein
VKVHGSMMREVFSTPRVDQGSLRAEEHTPIHTDSSTFGPVNGS